MWLSLWQVFDQIRVCKCAEEEAEYEKKNKMVFCGYIHPFLLFLELRHTVVVTKKHLLFLTE